MSTVPERIREKAVAAAEAIYRVSEISAFDAVLRFELRKHSVEIITGIAGLMLAGANGDETTRSRLFGSLVGIVELVRFGRDMHFIASENADLILGAYASIQNGLDDPEPPGSGSGPDISVKGVSPLPVNPRQEKILEYVGTHGQAHISHLRGLLAAAISEKTLQRDLSELVSSGRLRRHGDNRWTTYSYLGHS